MVSGEELDLIAEDRAAKIVDRHFCRDDAAGSDDVRIEAGHVVDIADHDLVRGGMGRQRKQ